MGGFHNGCPRGPFRKARPNGPTFHGNNCYSRFCPRTAFTTVICHLSMCMNRVMRGLGRVKICSGAVVVFTDSGNPRVRNKTSPSFFGDGKV